jgi:hypothetical protein
MAHATIQRLRRYPDIPRQLRGHSRTGRTTLLNVLEAHLSVAHEATNRL